MLLGNTNEQFFSDNDLSVKLAEKLENQDSGHGRILKCVCNSISCLAKPSFHFETSAYLSLKKTPLEPYIPKYFGTYKKDGTNYVIIEDLTAGFSSPCIADLKIGTVSWDPLASEEKKERMKRKRIKTTTETLAVRICGIVMQSEGAVVKRLSKGDGAKLDETQFYSELKNFIPESLQTSFKNTVEEIISLMKKTLCNHPAFRIYSSSLLILYDGDNPNEIRAKIIDLAHCHIDISVFNVSISDAEFDDGVLSGLNNIIHE